MLEALPLAGRGRAAQYGQALVDLDRVAVDRDRVLPTLAQALGELDRDPGLAGRGRTEDREEGQGTRE